MRMTGTETVLVMALVCSWFVYRVFAAPRLDRARISRYLAERRPEMTVGRIQWIFLTARVWASRNRYYKVSGTQEGKPCDLYCQTSLLGGVFVTEDPL